MARKRINGEGTIRRRPNGTWEARITIGTDPASGKLIRKSIYGRTQAEVKIKLTELQPQDIQTAEHGVTVEEWLNEWRQNYLSDIKDGSVASYESICRNHIVPSLGKTELTQLKTQDIQRFYNSLKDKKLSSKYIKNIHGCLHRALDMAVRLEYISKNPTSSCVIPRVTQQQIVPLDIPQQQQLFNVLSNEFYGTMFLVDAFTGLRVGELIGLTWNCVDFEHGILHIDKQLVQPRHKGQPFKFGSLKNDKTRILSPAQDVMSWLKDHKASQDKQKEILGDLWMCGEFPDLVFTHPDGSHLSQPTVWKEFQKILKKAGLEHYRVHDLRHTFAVNSIMAGDDIKTIQENMGHYSSAFTLDRYGHVTETMRRNSANRMQAFISNIVPNS